LLAGSQDQLPCLKLPIEFLQRVYPPVQTPAGHRFVPPATARSTGYTRRDASGAAEFFGSKVLLVTDVGVAGIRRLFNRLGDIRKARVVIAVAGMEGALAGVIAGLVSAPAIAVPTSVGYGAAFEGLAARLGMLMSCSPEISVVNIDNGFGAGYQANLINMAGKSP
jgi:NCAIR mutase (PurE)-related protein